MLKCSVTQQSGQSVLGFFSAPPAPLTGWQDNTVFWWKIKPFAKCCICVCVCVYVWTLAVPSIALGFSPNQHCACFCVCICVCVCVWVCVCLYVNTLQKHLFWSEGKILPSSLDVSTFLLFQEFPRNECQYQTRELKPWSHQRVARWNESTILAK